MNNTAENIVPGIIYDNGFRIGDKTLPFYDLVKTSDDASWFDEMERDDRNILEDER